MFFICYFLFVLFFLISAEIPYIQGQPLNLRNLRGNKEKILKNKTNIKENRITIEKNRKEKQMKKYKNIVKRNEKIKKHVKNETMFWFKCVVSIF